MKKTLVAAAAVIAVTSGAMIGQAAAADLEYVPPPVYAPAPPPFVPTWQGFYVGGHVGYGEANVDVRNEFDYFEFEPNDPDADADGFLPGLFNTFESGLSPNGLIGGVQGGYNWQMNSLVLGIEGDVSFADWGESRTTFDVLDGDLDFLDADEDAFGNASADVDMLASVRGRLGFAMNNLLIYGTGGIAWADATARAAIEFDDDIDDAVLPFRRTGKEDFDDIGFVVGAGMGWMVIPQTFSVGIEGLYYFFDEEKTLIDDTLELDNGDEIGIRATASLDDAWVIRARADFNF